MSKKILFIFSMLLSFGSINGATITSTGTGNWATTTSWIGGVVPTALDDVIIAAGSTITVSSNVSVKSLTINGTLLVSGDSKITTSAGNTITAVINGILSFVSNQSSISFPSGTILDINPPGKIDNSQGCSNQVAIFIGSVKFAVCAGSGNAEYTFEQLNTLGGTLQSNPTSNAPVCEGTSLVFNAAKDGADGASLNWSWSIKPPGAASFTTYPNKQSIITFVNAISGSYEANLTYTTTYGGSVYTSSKTIFATVNPKPVTPTISTSGPTTFCSGGSVTLTSSVGTSYVWSTGATTQSIVVTATGSYSVQVANASGCQSIASTATAVTVNPKPVTPTISTSGPTTFCLGGSVTLTSSVGTSYVWSTGATTQSIVVTATGSYSVQVANASGCQSIASAATAVTVNPKPVAPTISASGPTTFCQGDNVTLTSSIGSSYLWSTGATTQSVLVTSTGNYSVQVANASGCQSLPSNVTVVTTKSLPSTPISGTIIQPTCITPTGSIHLSGLLATPNWVITQKGTILQTYTASGTEYTIPNLVPGTYTFSIHDGVNCSSLATASIEIKAPETNIWRGSSLGWSKGSAPTSTSTESIDFAEDYQSTGDLTGCSCKIESGKNILINSGHTLYIENGLTVATTASLTFENHSSLVQANNNSGINSGKITYKRIAAQIRLADYVYWSTPVTPQRLIDVSPSSPSDKFFYYTTSGWKSIVPTNNMVVGKGYIIRGPSTYSNTAKADFPASFIGVPNNGTLIGETMVAGKFYLIGNPYPSALDADTFILENSFLDGTLYFWTHNTPVVLTGAYKYSASDYASYNLTGGVGGGTTALSGNPSNPKERPTGFIGAGQSFFASAATPGTLSFNNGMRLGGANNTQFFKSSTASKTKAIEKHRVWLNMTNAEGAFKQMLIGYIQGATNEYEARYDGVSFDANPYLDFYSIGNGNNYVIQARALPFTDTDEVPLGYRTTIAGNFTISIDEADGNLTNQTIYLEDKTTNVIHDLTTSDYTFTSAVGTFTDRFILKYKNKSLGTGDFENQKNAVLVSIKDKVIKVMSGKENIKEVVVFDISGKLLFDKNKIEKTEFSIQDLHSSNQILLIKVILQNEYITTEKIIFQ